MSQVGMLRRVSLITVLFGGADVIARSIRSAQENATEAGLELEVILVDNRPGDGTSEVARSVVPDVVVLENGENVGFGRACNQGFERATGQWWLLLNPDAELESGALRELVAFAASHPRAAAVAPTLVGAGTDRAESAGMQPSLRAALGHFLLVNRTLRGDAGGAWRGIQVQRRPELGPRRVEWASAGALLLRPGAVRDVGGFDPSFFLYAEDVDLGRRLDQCGWETWVVPSASAFHSIAASQGGVTDRWYVALHDYYSRDAGRVKAGLFDLIAATGLTLRALIASDDRLHRHRMAVAARTAFRLAGRTAIFGTGRD